MDFKHLLFTSYKYMMKYITALWSICRDKLYVHILTILFTIKTPSGMCLWRYPYQLTPLEMYQNAWSITLEWRIYIIGHDDYFKAITNVWFHVQENIMSENHTTVYCWRNNCKLGDGYYLIIFVRNQNHHLVT